MFPTVISFYHLLISADNETVLLRFRDSKLLVTIPPCKVECWKSKMRYEMGLTVVASDVVYNEDVVPQLLHTLRGLAGPHTTVLLAGELRNGNLVLHKSQIY